MVKMERPPHWVSFHIVPNYFEYWSESAYRIHDRKVYDQR